MNGNLLKLSTENLLEKFGAGNHKPGSGSAVAFQGMLSANLVHTVITLTTEEERRKYYGDWFSELLNKDQDILDRIKPRLERLFEEDSIQFDKVITLRDARDEEKDLVKKSDYQIEHLKELKIATEIPIEIAKLCKEVAEMADYVFKYGFQSARGDTCVALNGAVSSIAGCISIIDLNLLSFHSNEWTERIRSEVNQLMSTYENLYQISIQNSKSLKDEAKRKDLCQKEINALIKGIQAKTKFSNSDIEESALQLQRIIWKHKDTIWKRNKPENPIDILKPGIVLKRTLGYQFYIATELGSNKSQKESNEIAGVINQKKKAIYISNRFPEETQNFTAAHELGHALFHKQTVIHRDRALDGSMNPQRSPREYQADKFAAYFLMPTRQIKEVFQEWFSTQKFIIDENTAFNLIKNRPSILKDRCKNLRGLSRRLASAEYFGPTPLTPMSKLFNVSVEAMAIRLEELELLEF